MPTTSANEGPGEVIFAGISDTQLEVETAWNAVESAHTGAVVTFGGIVRDHDSGRAVTQLNYSAHPSAPARMVELVTEVAERHPGTRVWAAHRVGELHIGDPALVAAAASAHRAEAFAACSDLVETVKAHVPVWKEQFFADGEVQWVGSA